MEKYADYLRCGEIYKSPSQSERSPYILKCFQCSDVFMLLESFIFHIEDYCKQEEAAAALTAVTTVKTEDEYQQPQEFSIEMVEENYSGFEEENRHEERHNVAVMEEEDVVCIKEEKEELHEENLIEIKNEPIADSDTEPEEADDVYVSDIFIDVKEENDDDNHNGHESEEDLDHFGIQGLSEDTESAEESTSLPPASFVLKFLESSTNGLTFINNFKKRPILWNKNVYLHSEKKYQACLEHFTRELNIKLKLNMSTKEVLQIISYLQRVVRDECKSNSTVPPATSKSQWYLELLRFLGPFVDSSVFSKFDKSLPPLLPPQIIEIMNIYKTLPHLWNSDTAEYCCQNKRTETEKIMLDTIEERLNLKFTHATLQKLIRCMHDYYAKEKYKRLENRNVEMAADDEPNYYTQLMFLNNHVFPFKCPVCDKYIKSPFLMRIHMSKHDGSMPLHCSICKRGYKMIGHYVSHVRRHMNDYTAACSVCNEQFLNLPELENHMADHTKWRAYKCKKCDAAYSNIGALTNHVKTHEIAKTIYKCRTCAKTFNSKEAAKNHVDQYHTYQKRKEAAHLCHTCGKGFTNPKSLLVHEALHTANKNFECRKCGKVLKTKFNYYQHMRTHGLGKLDTAKKVGLKNNFTN